MNSSVTTHPPHLMSPAASARILRRAQEVLRIEADAVAALINQLDDQMVAAAQAILNCEGRVVVSGMGKSGHVARKTSATLASTGTPAFFLHPAEARHGDLGMIQSKDVVLAFSNSGETEELSTIAPHIKRLGATLIAITGNPLSTLAKIADIHLNASVKIEACPLNLAPTASTTAALALGDALALVLLDLREFSAEDFARSHPGGSLGRKLLMRVEDVMRQGAQVPRVLTGSLLTDALVEISAKRMGMTAVVNDQGHAVGIFTDGDLRRMLAQGIDVRNLTVDQVMTKSPRTIGAESLASEVAHLMDTTRINHLLVVSDTGALLGAVGIHDLLEFKIL